MWNKGHCELGSLRRATKVVTCPGCERSETTIRIRQRHDSVTLVECLDDVHPLRRKQNV